MSLSSKLLTHPRLVLVALVAVFAVALAFSIYEPSLYAAVFGHNSHVFQAGTVHFKFVNFDDGTTTASNQGLTYQSQPCWYRQ